MSGSNRPVVWLLLLLLLLHMFRKCGTVDLRYRTEPVTVCFMQTSSARCAAGELWPGTAVDLGQPGVWNPRR
jgi:hypothetical protein